MRLLLAFSLGIVAGLRSMTAPAAVSWAAHLGWIVLESTPFAFIGRALPSGLLALFAVGELVADKLPFTPSRLLLFPLSARLVSGGFCGAVVFAAAGGSIAVGAVAGALGGLTGAFAGYHARHYVVGQLGLPDFVVALIEDVLAVGGGLFLASRI